MTRRTNRRSLSLVTRAAQWLEGCFGGEPVKSCRTGRKSPPRHTLGVESLEERRVLATMAVLDFTGGTISAAQMSEGGWPDQGAKTVENFRDLFNNSRPGLDMNASGTVNGTDADLAIQRIVSKVKSHYAPYNIGITTGEQHLFHAGLMNDSDPGDVIVMVSGGRDILEPDDPAWGWSPVDHGNWDDQYAFAFAQGMIDDAGFTTDKFINSIARTISHEMAHSFGLDHVTAGTDEVSKHHLMSASFENSSGVTVDNRDYDHYFNFPNQSIITEAGLQNAHTYLTQTLGASTSPWLAMLSPGVLTITGNNSANTITVSQPQVGKLDVTLSGTTTRVDMSSPGINSINPYSTGIGSMVVKALNGNDTVTINANVTIPAHVWGGSGNDTIQGGGAADVLYGEAGTDTLRGGGGADYLNGGAGNDTLKGESGNDTVYGGSGNDNLNGGSGADKLYGQDGDDDLYGGTGNDRLYGGDGYDDLFGEDGNDWLDGGDEWYNARDYLFGGLGLDTFVQHKGLLGNYDEDFVDAASNEPVIWG